MTKEERSSVIRLQKAGYGYRRIAANLSLPLSTVKSWCRRHPIQNDQNDNVCLNCGVPIQQTPHKRRRKFCSDRCRNAWWSSHPEMRNSKTVYHHICLFCGRDYSNNRISGSYYSRECFARARMKVNQNG